MKVLLVILALHAVGAEAVAQVRCPFSSPAGSAMGWRFGAGDSLLTGRVVRVETGQPIAEARVQLRLPVDTTFDGNPAMPRFATVTDSLGRFQIGRIPSNQYRLRVMTMSMSASDTLTIGGSGLSVLVALAPWDGDIVCVGPAVNPPAT